MNFSPGNIILGTGIPNDELLIFLVGRIFSSCLGMMSHLVVNSVTAQGEKLAGLLASANQNRR